MSMWRYNLPIWRKRGENHQEENYQRTEQAHAAVESARREYQLGRFVDPEQFHIPYENLEDPMVHRLVSAARDTEALKTLVSPTGSWRNMPERAPLLERLRCSQDLLTAAQTILEEQLTRKTVNLPIIDSLSRAAQRYGRDVLETAGPVAHPPMPPVHSLPDDERPTGLWTWPPQRYGELPSQPEGYQPWWDNYHPHIDEDRRQTPARQARLEDEAGRLNVPAGMLAADRTLRNLCSALLDANDLLRETEDTDGLPDTPGLTPPARARLARVTSLNRLVVAVLEDEFHPGQLTPERFAAALAEVTKHYGLRIAKRDKPGTLEQITKPGQQLPLPDPAPEDDRPSLR